MTISGLEYIKRIDSLNNEVWINGQKISGKISDHPAFKGILKSKAHLFDMQKSPLHKDLLTFRSPSNKEIGFSFQQPKTIEDLQKRRIATKLWSKTNAGLLGRSPDYVNSGIMALGVAHELFGKNDPKYGTNILRTYEKAMDYDLTFTHTFINPQVNRSASYLEDSSSNIIAAKVVKETSDGIIIHGARLLSTQGGITDEILVIPAGGNFIDESYIYAFAIPSNTPGLKFLGRESFVLNDSPFDSPLSSRFEEMDTVVVFDNVLVPWENVFLYKDYNIAYSMFTETNFNTLLLYQAVTRMIVKTEFILGLSEAIVDAINIGEYQHVKDKVSEIIVTLEILKGLQLSAEIQAKENSWGTLVPDAKPLNAAINYYPRIYPRLVEIIQLLSGSSLITLPTELDFQSPVREYIDLYLQGANSCAEDKIKLFRLAWDFCMSPFGTRQTHFERFFFGDPVKLGIGLYNGYEKGDYVNFINEFL
ncbi:4-hydroxyphenylacetate 3-monooxygenase, oxygenase component [Bacillus sp. FJAT-49736]|uniref:4-hydroxyphenylacetate 3-monooxygenase, oxygenase component n=1 Tax=Bacillus sp. FJAT-49736 TaxID=2833582 RepID=UPI001BC8F413|nr:4-hydroxyphenylacetate 3-monooxygenase, oxygenase component [Bacillus sp. FJAT-49736]MBS4173098.1 4-hydroxyphenylacetate 3-monooxygenase, oxygenase component [Bacillus sp. FJAT-49736]